MEAELGPIAVLEEGELVAAAVNVRVELAHGDTGPAVARGREVHVRGGREVAHRPVARRADADRAAGARR